MAGSVLVQLSVVAWAGLALARLGSHGLSSAQLGLEGLAELGSAGLGSAAFPALSRAGLPPEWLCRENAPEPRRCQHCPGQHGPCPRASHPPGRDPPRGSGARAGHPSQEDLPSVSQLFQHCAAKLRCFPTAPRHSRRHLGRALRVGQRGDWACHTGSGPSHPELPITAGVTPARARYPTAGHSHRHGPVIPLQAAHTGTDPPPVPPPLRPPP